MTEARHGARRAGRQLVEQTHATETTEHRYIEPRREVRDSDRGRRGLGLHPDRERTGPRQRRHLFVGDADTGDHRVVLNEHPDSRLLVQPAQRIGGHRGVRVGDLRHQRCRGTRHRAEQSKRLSQHGFRGALGQPEHVRHIGRLRDGLGDGSGLGRLQRRRLAENAERDQSAATILDERRHLVAQGGQVDIEVIVERGGQYSPETTSERCCHS